MDNFTKFQNDIYDALLSYGFTRLQLLVVLYVIRKTDGWHKPAGDYISIRKMFMAIIERSIVYYAVNESFKGNH